MYLLLALTVAATDLAGAIDLDSLQASWLDTNGYTIGPSQRRDDVPRGTPASRLPNGVVFYIDSRQEKSIGSHVRGLPK